MAKNTIIILAVIALIAMHTIRFNINLSHDFQSFAHFAAFATCALISNRLRIHIFYIILAAILLELSQNFTSRSFEMIDLCSDIVGIYTASQFNNFLESFKKVT